MKTQLTILLLFVFSALTAQRILPGQIRKETGSDKQKIIMSDATTGIYSATSDGVILPYDTQRGADGDYDVNDIVTFGGYIYRSQVNNNVTTPGVGTWELLSASAVDSTRLAQDSILVYYQAGSEIGRDTISGLSGGAESIGPSTVIRRTLTVGDTITASTPGGFLAWFEFAPPTLSAITFTPSATVYEVGTSTAITLSGTTSNPASATLSGGSLERISPTTATINSFGTSTSYSQGITFTPQQGGSGVYNELAYTFRASQDYSGTETGTAQSATKSLTAVYPVFYGMASTDTATVFSNIYGTLTKSVTTEGNKTYSFTGTGLIYYCFPNTWADTNLSSITDPNGFNVTASFDRVPGHTLTSTGLTNNYTAEPCTCYVLNTGSTTTSSSSYTFNQ